MLGEKLVFLALLLTAVLGFVPLMRFPAATLSLLECRKGTGKDGDFSHVHVHDEENDEINKSSESVPMIGSRKSLFGSLQLPRDSIDQALRSRIADGDSVLKQEGPAGLQRDSPTEIRTKSQVDEDGNEEDIVETVDTFRFTMSKAEFERAMDVTRGRSDETEEDGEEIDAGRRLLADSAFLELLGDAEYEIREDGKKVLRVEMDMDDLGSMLGVASDASQESPSGSHDGRIGGRRSTNYDSDLMNRAQARVALSLQKEGSNTGSTSGRGQREEQRLGMFESGLGKPRWEVSGVGLGPVLGDLVGSVGVIVCYTGVLKAASVTGHYAVRWMRLSTMKKYLSKLYGVTIPWLSLWTLASYVGFHSVQHFLEGQRFRGIGFAPPRKSLLKRLFPSILEVD